MVCIYGESEITHISKQSLVNLLSAVVLTRDAWSQREKLAYPVLIVHIVVEHSDTRNMQSDESRLQLSP